MQLVNPLTAYPIGARVEDINDVPMRGVAEKQGVAFSRHGWLEANRSGGDADAIGAAVRRALRPLSEPTLLAAREDYAARNPGLFPRYFIIEPTALCNRRCPFCPIIVTNRHGMMKIDHFDKLMVECSKHEVYGLSLYQLGEPLLWHGKMTGIYDGTEKRVDISYMINYAKKVGGFRAVNLSTNGDVKSLDCIFGSELDDLFISIDGTTADVYDANRPSTTPNDAGAFRRTLDRVRDFLENKSARGGAKPWVRLQIINKDNTREQVLDFIRYWIAVPGVDDVLVKHLDSMRPWLGLAVVSDEEDAIKAARVAATPCQHIYSVGSMVADGRFNACCHDAHTELTTTGANIDNMTFYEWWNGDYMRALRAEHETNVAANRRMPCRECREMDTWLG